MSNSDKCGCGCGRKIKCEYLLMPGARGPPGEDFFGKQGAQGDPGKVGQQGAQGEPGMDGSQGAPGPGIQGAKGNPGQDGSQGAQGNPGQDGSQGAQGNPGQNGNQGAQGNPGQDGSQGAQGNPGQDGSQGAQGNPGQDGSQGAQGNPGQMGTQGSQGNPGQMGQQGAQGNPGNPGQVATRYLYNEATLPVTYTDSIMDNPPTILTLSSDGSQIKTYGILIVQVAGEVVNYPGIIPTPPGAVQFNIYISTNPSTMFTAEMIVPITSVGSTYRVLAAQSFYMILPPTGTPFDIYVTIACTYLTNNPALQLSSSASDWFNALLLYY